MSYESEKELLEKKLDGVDDFFQRMEIMDEIINLKVKYGLLQTPNLNGPIECVGCGS
jgi:hypothetical protein